MKLVVAAAGLLAGVPATAAIDTYIKIPPADQKIVAQCKAMKHDAMMKSATCQKMMRLYPAAFTASAGTN